MAKPPPQFLHVADVAYRVGLSAQTIRREIVAGELSAQRTPGGHYRITSRDAHQYISRMNATNATNVTNE